MNRFPSVGKDRGFKLLADYVHCLGLKFGIHIIRGIPKQAVARNLPIAGSNYRAAEAADTCDTCGWNHDNYGVRHNAAGQAYYDSIAKLYAGWEVDFVKIDCISQPYKTASIHYGEPCAKEDRQTHHLQPLPRTDAARGRCRCGSRVWCISFRCLPNGSTMRGQVTGRTPICCPSAGLGLSQDGNRHVRRISRQTTQELC